MSRPETGCMKFGKDFPGVFIRGDNAFNFANSLKRVIAKLPNDKASKIDKKILEELSTLFESSNTRSKLYYEDYVQKCKPWNECKDEKSD